MLWKNLQYMQNLTSTKELEETQQPKKHWKLACIENNILRQIKMIEIFASIL